MSFWKVKSKEEMVPSKMEKTSFECVSSCMECSKQIQGQNQWRDKREMSKVS